MNIKHQTFAPLYSESKTFSSKYPVCLVEASIKHKEIGFDDGIPQTAIEFNIEFIDHTTHEELNKHEVRVIHWHQWGVAARNMLLGDQNSTTIERTTYISLLKKPFSGYKKSDKLPRHLSVNSNYFEI